MRPLHRYVVLPSLPKRLRALLDIAYNLWFSWEHEAVDLFRRIDVDLWRKSHHNPVTLLATVGQKRLEELSSDEGYLAQMDRVARHLERYLKDRAWYQTQELPDEGNCIAYFSLEFGVADCLPLYSGGLGILAGDHLKSASDLGLPLVGVSLMYQTGKARQYLNRDGWQGEAVIMNDFYNIPISPVTNGERTPVIIEIPLENRLVYAQIWKSQVGRVPLYLLDTNIKENSPQDQQITDELYGGDLESRIQQEIVLGIGGVIALQALDLAPTACHMNEGHSAFLGLERIRQLRQSTKLNFSEALEATRVGNLFTTHTPVPAGIDKFPEPLIQRYLAPYVEKLGISWEQFMGLGRIDPADAHEEFSMAVLALNLAAKANGVSKLHRIVSQDMWQNAWPGVPLEEVPIDSITNGVHFKSWISEEMADLYDRYLGTDWSRYVSKSSIWKRIDRIPIEELWRTHERRKAILISFARQQLHSQLKARGAPSMELDDAMEALNPEALTIGFARRFATYKRSTLIMSDIERLKKILGNKERPVQLIFAGRAHPKDNPGKEMIRQVIHLARYEDLRNKIVFLEDYDLNLARYMVQGVDVWLNTPRRPLEASGTSGMKASANGAINLSILDGWWDEAYNRQVGWAIDLGEDYDDHAYQDTVEASALYDLLEGEVLPLFYTRGRDGLPREWLNMMKAGLKELCPVFNTHRMVMEYAERFYMPSFDRVKKMTQNNYKHAKELAVWKERIRKEWEHIRTLQVTPYDDENLHIDDKFAVRVLLNLGQLSPDDVQVELWNGLVNPDGEIVKGQPVALSLEKTDENGNHQYHGAVDCQTSGQMGYALRILPRHPDMTSPFETRLITWAT
jgi:glycogen phosphorylase